MEGERDGERGGEGDGGALLKLQKDTYMGEITGKFS